MLDVLDVWTDSYCSILLLLLLRVFITHESRQARQYSVRRRLSACLSVRSLTQKRMIPKSSNLVKGMISGYSISVMVFLGQKVRGHRVTKCKNVSKAIEWPA